MPFIDIGPLAPFGLKIHLFGILVATGVVVGSWLGARYAEKNEIDVDWLRWAAFRVVIVGFVLAHVIDVVFYQPDKLAKDPALLVYLWQGFSSYGGFIGGIVGFMWFTRKQYEPPVTRMELGDCFVYGFATGFWFGRLGCTTAHDHAGRASEFMFAVIYPSGKHPHAPTAPTQGFHDLGLYEAMFLMPAIMLGLFLLSKWKKRKPGLLAAFFAISYAIPRFFLDYLRFPESDPRYLGLTPGQYFSIGLLAGGLFILFKMVPSFDKTVAELVEERRLVSASRTKKPGQEASGDKDVPKATAKPKLKPKPKSKSAAQKKKRKKK